MIAIRIEFAMSLACRAGVKMLCGSGRSPEAELKKKSRRCYIKGAEPPQDFIPASNIHCRTGALPVRITN